VEREYALRHENPRKFEGGSAGGKLFARPVASDSDPTPTTHPAGALAWFQPEYGPAHTDAGDPKGSPKEAWPLLECPASTLCVLERFDGHWYAVPLCEGT
jgi:hypothetical protein